MNILVTGANGFAGSHVCAALRSAGHAVRGMMRPGGDPGLLADPDIVRVEGDVTVPASLPPVLEGIDAVVHLAGAKQASRTRTYQRVNIEGTAHVAEAARAAGVSRFVMVSTIAAQGPSPRGGGHTHGGSEAPINAYGRSKLAAEQRLRQRFGQGATILRPCLLYGPGDPHLLSWARLVQRRVIPVVPDLPLSFLHVVDLATAIGQVLEHPNAPIGPFFLSDDHPVTMGAVVDQLERLLQSGPVMRLPVPTKALSTWRPAVDLFSRTTGLGPLASRRLAELSATGWVCRAEAARDAFGFAPRHRLADGLPGTIAWYRGEGLLS